MKPDTPVNKVLSFGEILWDIFPTGKRIGGAPFNVAYNLNKMGIDARMISAVGNDDMGREILKIVKDNGISIKEIQITDRYETGTVIARIDQDNEVHYTIVEPVAWDNICWREEYSEGVKNADAFVFGSLSTRNNTSQKTLLKLLETAPYKVFDINIRPPFVSPESIMEFMKKVDLVKMNKAELRQLIDWIGEEYITEEEAVKYIRKYFRLDALIITKGSKGAVYHDKNNYLFAEAVKVDVKDTVGSGDSFLAGFLSEKLKGKSVEESLQNAILLGAFITAHQGACPPYTAEEFLQFKKEKQ